MSLDAFFEFEPRDWDTAPDGTVRFAVVGCGGFARDVVLPALDAADYCEPTVAVSGTDATRTALADRYDTVGIDYDAYAAGEATDAYDAVYLATPNRLHLPHAETAARLGKPVVSEKPLEATVERAERMVDACADAGVLLATAYRMQSDPAVLALRDFLQRGGVGDVTALAGDFTVDALAEDRGPDQWRLDPELAGGGALMDLGVYPLNLARFLLGTEPEWVDGHTRGSGPYADVDEHVAFHVGFPDAFGSFSASFTGQTNASFRVQGTEGNVVVRDAFQPNRPRTMVVERGDERVTFDGRGGGEVREMCDRVAHAVLTGESVGFDGADGLADVRLMAQVYAAAEGERGE
ncbi:Gfo/Idh/MocA family protein [Halorarius litoreus]|uniref:Gfo/Idh/MocA family protein n=1 Tax=Halorarius litoreus TaxID=2962676 RepID=UPI0020CF1933|nr:Gfo/Idh/MocA family oxidoreductase [Halorarius litoreus]